MDESLLAPWMASALQQDGRAQLVDLRRGGGTDLPRIPGARVIPLDELPGEFATLDRERPVVFVSDTGRRAAEATEVLRFAEMTAGAIDDGIRAWLEAELPIGDRRTPSSGDSHVISVATCRLIGACGNVRA